MSEAIPGPGHNRPPITPPTEDEFLADLQARYPKVNPTFKELSEKFDEAPKIIKDEESAGKVQDLYRTMREWMDEWDGARKKEKKPWDKITKLAQSFFASKTDALETMSINLRARHTAYAEEKAEAARKAAEAEAERQRKESERLRRDAEEAEQRRVAAELAEREAREREERARQEEIAARKRREEEEERGRLAREEEKRLEAERRERDKAEKELLATRLKDAGKLLGSAEILFKAMQQDGDDAPVPQELDAAIGIGSALMTTLARIAGHALLTDEQRDKAVAMSNSMRAMRVEIAERLNKKEQKRRAKEEEEHRKLMAVQAEEAKAKREKEEAILADVRRRREEAEAAAALESQKIRDARKDTRAAQADQNSAAAEGRDAEREARDTGRQADKTEKRADRLDNKVATSSDAEMSQTRGSFSVGSLSGRWEPRVVDRDTLVATLGVLAPYIPPDAVDAALTKYMRQHQGEWADKRKDGTVAGKIPGVVFDFVPRLKDRVMGWIVFAAAWALVGNIYMEALTEVKQKTPIRWRTLLVGSTLGPLFFLYTIAMVVARDYIDDATGEK